MKIRWPLICVGWRLIANFRQVVKEGELRMHPQVAGLVEPEMLLIAPTKNA
jgi:hypothetical protein